MDTAKKSKRELPLLMRSREAAAELRVSERYIAQSRQARPSRQGRGRSDGAQDHIR